MTVRTRRSSAAGVLAMLAVTSWVRGQEGVLGTLYVPLAMVGQMTLLAIVLPFLVLGPLIAVWPATRSRSLRPCAILVSPDRVGELTRPVRRRWAGGSPASGPTRCDESHPIEPSSPEERVRSYSVAIL